MEKARVSIWHPQHLPQYQHQHQHQHQPQSSGLVYPHRVSENTFNKTRRPSLKPIAVGRSLCEDVRYFSAHTKPADYHDTLY